MQVMYHDVTTWTHEPEHTRSLVIAIKQPVGFDTSVILNISVQDNCYTIEFPLLPGSDPIEANYCMFSIPEPNGELLQMETEIRNQSLTRFRNKDDSVGTLSLNIAIHPESLENDIISILHLPLQDLLASEQNTQPKDTSNIVVTNTELSLDDIIHGAEFTSAETVTHSLNQHTTEVRQVLSGNWKNFNLKPLDSETVKSRASILLSYCWLNVKREFIKEATTATNQMEEILEEMGYISKLESDSLREEEIRKLQDTHTQEIDSLKLDAEKEAAAVSEEQMEQLDYLKSSNTNFQNEILQLASKLKTQQEMYESKLEQLLESLNTERSRQTASKPDDKLPHLDKSTSPLISTSNLQYIETSHKKPLVVTYPNPNWEEMVRGNFLERLEIFSDYMIKKQTHLRDKIRTQVSRGIEMQLATQHRLAPINTFKSYYDVCDDISLPSIFMPTQCSKHLAYTPRARAYFHPFGTKSTRICQPPTIFKLSHSHIPSINLYALSENYSSRMGEWQTQEDREHPNSVLVAYKSETPAPPPSTSMSFRASTASSVA
ncbi:hypothetical protein LOD99_4999 [Oopsacas minuta]|uniref:Uncharacterized protein n=1 Tax=Oopsacas minuta TaxID=111878 RepID=A0AAV7JSR7_9METZ|nr:hypothetical protein LOD99_4999 [Oopsacas minuta]